MAPKWTFSKMRSRLGRLVMASVAVCCLGSLGAWADLVISVGSVTADGGSTGNPLDVDLTNTGPSAVPIGGFSFGVSIANPNVSFTDANTSTAAFYIFTGNSLFGPDLTGPTSGKEPVRLHPLPQSLEFPPLPFRSVTNHARLSALHIQIRYLRVSQPFILPGDDSQTLLRREVEGQSPGLIALSPDGMIRDDDEISSEIGFRSISYAR